MISSEKTIYRRDTIMKKTISILLILITILSFTACAKPTANVSNATQMPLPTEVIVEAPTPTPTVYPETKTIEMSELKDYTIVYPSAYNEFRMDIVDELKAVIDAVTGSNVNIASDAEAVDGNKIILASATTEHSFKKEIDAFDDAMDYLIAVDGDNIVLGGKNYYADMRAMYAFAENNLGYTSYDNKYTDETKAISGVNITDYKHFDYMIQAATWGPNFLEEQNIKDMADCNFNALMAHNVGGGYGKQGIHNLTKWMAKYEIELMLNMNRSAKMYDAELYWDCPMIYGASLWDEPHNEDMVEVQRLCEEFIENYNQYGWKPFVNYSGAYTDIPHANDCSAVSYDWYIFVCLSYTGDPSGSVEGCEAFNALESMRNLASQKNQKYWKYIQAYRRKDGVFNPSKAFRWQMYMDLCFGVEGTMYFAYTWGEGKPGEGEWSAAFPESGLVSQVTLEKNENYDYAQIANAEILKMYDILKNYESIGAYTINKRDYYFNAETNPSNTWLGSFDEYTEFDVIEDFVAASNDDGKKTQYLVGCFEKDNSDESAFILMGIDLITDNEYGSDTDRLTKVKINGENPKFYFEGELMDLKPDADGYYTLNVANGYCWLITVE